MMSSSGLRRVADHMVIAAAALKAIAKNYDVNKPTGMAAGIKLPRELPSVLTKTNPRIDPTAITKKHCVKSHASNARAKNYI